MKEPVLVIMAAGMGSRYGGLKQIDPIDEYGNIIIDYSIYDAVKAGFKKVIFIIKKENEEDFKNAIGNRICKYIEVEYVFQELTNIPEEQTVPEGRVKPWGTGHAILSCKDKIDGPFAVINSDDYYGSHAFSLLYNFLSTQQDDDKYRFMMVGYLLKNTLTDNGHVSRGICSVNEENLLMDIKELTHIQRINGEVMFTEDNAQTFHAIDEDSTASMNMWGFSESILGELNSRFSLFLQETVKTNPLKGEYFLPTVVNDLIKEGKASVKVQQSFDKWYGITYHEDKEMVMDAIKKLKNDGYYPEKLW